MKEVKDRDLSINDQSESLKTKGGCLGVLQKTLASLAFVIYAVTIRPFLRVFRYFILLPLQWIFTALIRPAWFFLYQIVGWALRLVVVFVAEKVMITPSIKLITHGPMRLMGAFLGLIFFGSIGLGVGGLIGGLSNAPLEDTSLWGLIFSRQIVPLIEITLLGRVVDNDAVIMAIAQSLSSFLGGAIVGAIDGALIGFILGLLQPDAFTSAMHRMLFAVVQRDEESVEKRLFPQHYAKRVAEAHNKAAERNLRLVKDAGKYVTSGVATGAHKVKETGVKVGQKASQGFGSVKHKASRLGERFKRHKSEEADTLIDEAVVNVEQENHHRTGN